MKFDENIERNEAKIKHKIKKKEEIWNSMRILTEKERKANIQNKNLWKTIVSLIVVRQNEEIKKKNIEIDNLKEIKYHKKSQAINYYLICMKAEVKRRKTRFKWTYWINKEEWVKCDDSYKLKSKKWQMNRAEYWNWIWFFFIEK